MTMEFRPTRGMRNDLVFDDWTFLDETKPMSNRDRAMESDTQAQKATIDELINLLLLRHSVLMKIADQNPPHPHAETIKQARDSAHAELRWRMLSTVGLLDWWDAHRQYVIGFAPSGQWSGFDKQLHTCYADTTHDCLQMLQVMDKDLQTKAQLQPPSPTP